MSRWVTLQYGAGPIVLVVTGLSVFIGMTLFCLCVCVTVLGGKLPEEPLVRVSALAISFLFGIYVTLRWWEHGAPSPVFRVPARR